MRVPVNVTDKFESRNDAQIMCLELLAILMGLETFSERCRGKNIRVWTDNVGSEHALIKQAGRRTDHNAIVHSTWLTAARIGAGLFINRVPTHQNIADGPTRPNKDIAKTLLNVLGAEEVNPELPCELLTATDLKNMRF